MHRPSHVRPWLLAALCLVLVPAMAHGHALTLWAEWLDDGETVRIEVHTTDGRPAVGAAVRVTAADDTVRATGKTDDQGRFELRVSPREELTIHASSGGHHEATARLTAEGELWDGPSGH